MPSKPPTSQSLIPDPPPGSVDPNQLLQQALEQAGKVATEPKPDTPVLSGMEPGTEIIRNGKKYYYYADQGQVFLLPKPIEEMSEEDFYRAFSSVALADITSTKPPSGLTVVFKDAHIAGHWFQKSIKDQARVQYAIGLGFMPAHREDLKKYAKGLNDQDGAVEQGDLVLMMIHKATLYKTFADNLARARMKGNVSGYRNEAYTQLRPGQSERVSYDHTPQVAQETINQGRRDEGLGHPAIVFQGQ